MLASMRDQEVDVAVHPPLHHPLDPFANGKLVTRRVGDQVEIVEADRQILLDCGFLWDIRANSHLFAPWCQLIAPAPLELKSNFEFAPQFNLLDFPDLPTNRPVPGNSYPMCQHWTMKLTVGSRLLAYRIGDYRPSINVMEASQSY